MTSPIDLKNNTYKPLIQWATKTKLMDHLLIATASAGAFTLSALGVKWLLSPKIDQRAIRKEAFQKRYEEMHSTTLIMRQRKENAKEKAHAATVEKLNSEIDDLRADRDSKDDAIRNYSENTAKLTLEIKELKKIADSKSGRKELIQKG